MSSPMEQIMSQTGTTVNQPCDTHTAAAILGLAEQTLRKLRTTGKGPPFLKLGRAVRYRPADLHAWLAAHVMNSTSESREDTSNETR